MKNRFLLNFTIFCYNLDQFYFESGKIKKKLKKIPKNFKEFPKISKMYEGDFEVKLFKQENKKNFDRFDDNNKIFSRTV